MLPSNMLLLNLIPLINVTFSTPSVPIRDILVVAGGEMGPEDRKSGFPQARGSRHPLLLTHDVFFGGITIKPVA
jgi:hypothetical protein